MSRPVKTSVDTYWPEIHEAIERHLMRATGPDRLKFAPIPSYLLRAGGAITGDVSLHQADDGLVQMRINRGKFGDNSRARSESDLSS